MYKDNMKDIQHSYLIAVDNSLCKPGVAVFCEGLLVATGTMRQPKNTELNIAERVNRTARDVITFAIDKAPEPFFLAYEWPQVYTASKSKGDPNDLLGVVGVGGAVAGMLAMICFGRNSVLDVVAYKPAEWIGQIPKATGAKCMDSPRARRILSKLDWIEKEFVISDNDAIDAVGIGLYRLGRLKPTKVYPGSEKGEICKTEK